MPISKREDTPMAVKWDINLGTIVTIVIVVTSGMLWVNTQITKLDERVQNGEEFRAARSASTDKIFVDLSSSIKSLQESMSKLAAESANLTYRMGQSEANNGSSIVRMDRMADALQGSVESVKENVNNLAVKVEVMNQKIDSLDVPRTQKNGRNNNLMLPWYGEYNHTQPQKISSPAALLFPCWSRSSRRCD